MTKSPIPRIKGLIIIFALAIFMTVGVSANVLLATPLEQTAGGTVNRDSNVRSGPGVEYDILSVFTDGTEVEVVATNDDGTWYLLATGEWIAAFLVDTEASVELPAATSSAAPADASQAEGSTSESAESAPEPAEPYVATVSRAGNVRTGPSTLYDVVGEVAEGDTVTIVAQTPYGNWFQLDDESWISLSLIANPPGPMPYVTPPAQLEADDHESTEEGAPESSDSSEDTEAAEETSEPEAAEETSEPEAAEETSEPTVAPINTPTPAPTPVVTIPRGWSKVTDTSRGYSLALPPGWSELDLRGNQFAQLATTFGQGEAVSELQQYLDTPEGQAVGVVAITDIANTFFGGLPTVLNVSIIEAPGATPELLVDYINQVIELNEALFAGVNMTDLSATTVNNLPAVTGTGTGDLSDVGVNAEAFVKVVGLIANDRIYVLTMGTQAPNMARYEPIFDDIAGTFRPE